ncbi:RNA-directed DNA polymerase, eukaryota, reverse transcriptase zinc-binding domain protein [Tanacetum coccineum]|uniref:RNA-directed DNA polymerase, eukaryota, reverse transcriptase zinc-binding domain protein n=1 Tax=Tanacetum coccineum TaxID=301880 RepID=A0ABQ4ZBB0_9ASTR
MLTCRRTSQVWSHHQNSGEAGDKGLSSGGTKLNSIFIIAKIKGLKRHVKNLNWSYGNAFEKVIVLKDKLKTTQTRVDCIPHDPIVKEEEAKVLLEYKEVVSDARDRLATVHSVEIAHISAYSIIDVYKKKLTDEDNEMMISEVTSAEIKEALFDIRDNKSPSPSGYSVVFFNKSWSIVVQEIITNRIKSNLNKLVNSNQSAFIPGRMIQDNSYDIKVGPKRCTLKIDIAKAYDTVNWGFLVDILIQFGFLEKMVQWIKTCVKTTSFSININCENHGYFKGGRGLRQGDPISPYLFTLVMEVFSLMMQRNVQSHPHFKYHFGCKDLQITYLCLVDDLLVLCNGDLESITIPVLGLQQNVKDYIVWRSNDGSLKKFSTKQNYPDSYNHLYIQFHYSKKIWRDLKKKTKMVNMPDDWKGIIDAMNMQRKENTIKSVLRRLVMGVAVYFVCQEKNKRIFANEKRNVELLMDLISEKILLKLMSLEVKASTQVYGMIGRSGHCLCGVIEMDGVLLYG